MKKSKKQKKSYYDEVHDLLKNGINNLSDLIMLGHHYNNYVKHEYRCEYDGDDDEEYQDNFHPEDDFRTNINLPDLSKIVDDLDKLNNMIGMKEIKDTLYLQLLFYLQGLNDKNDFLHCVIYGNPGVGKTTIANMLAEIYRKMGILKYGAVKVATKDALIGEYIGQTAIKTKKFLESCIGNVMLFDEAYQISSGFLDKGDSYSKECINVLNQFLLEHRQDFVCILAGYKEDIEKCFFSLNKGLERRFPWRFEIKNYIASELEKIFKFQVQQNGWNLTENAISSSFFEKNIDLFKNSGGDCEILFNKIKICHSQRIINCTKESRKLITDKDFENGYQLFISAEHIKNRLEKEDSKIPFMYI